MLMSSKTTKVIKRDIKPIVLIVDDDIDIQELFQIYFSYIKDYQDENIYLARNGCDALNLLENLDQKLFPSIIITDFHMPEMDGVTFCNQLYLNNKNLLNEFVVVLYTAYANTMPFDQINNLFNNIRGIVRFKPRSVGSLIIDAEKLLMNEINR